MSTTTDAPTTAVTPSVAGRDATTTTITAEAEVPLALLRRCCSSPRARSSGAPARCGRSRASHIVTSDQPYWDLVIKGAQEAADQYDVKLTVHRAKPDVDRRRRSSAGWSTRSSPASRSARSTRSAQAAVLADVAGEHTLVTFDSDSPASPRLCFVGTDNYAAGRMCGQKVREALPDGGEVIISIGNLDKENGQRRRQGVIDELLDRPFEPDQRDGPGRLRRRSRARSTRSSRRWSTATTPPRRPSSSPRRSRRTRTSSASSA